MFDTKPLSVGIKSRYVDTKPLSVGIKSRDVDSKPLSVGIKSRDADSKPLSVDIKSRYVDRKPLSVDTKSHHVDIEPFWFESLQGALPSGLEVAGRILRQMRIMPVWPCSFCYRSGIDAGRAGDTENGAVAAGS